MAQMLRDEDSTDRHLDVTRRFGRRCRATRGAETLGDAVALARDSLSAKRDETKLRATEEEDRKDDLELRQLDAADIIRTLAGRAEEHDRTNPGASVHAALFAEGGFGALLDSSGRASDESCARLAAAVTSLGADHALAGFAAQLTDAAGLIRTAETAVAEALRARKLAEAAEELAQAALRKSYEHAYLDAKKALGARAERLFPRFRRTRKKKTEPDPTET